MADLPGCPCSICDEDSGNSGVPLPPEHGNNQNNFRTRIAATLKEARIVTYWREGIDEADGQPYRSLVIRSDEQAAEYAADAVIRELNLAKACQSGCVWQIPNRIEDMTPQQRELLGKPPLFGQHLAVGEDGPIMLNISPKDDDEVVLFLGEPTPAIAEGELDPRWVDVGHTDD